MAKILVVEDDESMNEVLTEMLEDDDHEVVSVFNGNDALKRCEKGKFDLVISDVRLPGMDGVETLTRIKALHPDQKCIIITGYASADTPVRAIRLKVNDYLFKPFSLDYFLGSVNRAIYLESERQTTFSLVQKLASFFSRSTDSQLEEVVEERQEAFRGLYLGVRSGYLNPRGAAEVYNRLEYLEVIFRDLLNHSEADPERTRELLELYRQLSDRIAKLELGADAQVGEEIVPPDQMAALYEAIKSSQIGLDDLQYAPLLRKTPDSRFETLQELLQVKHRLWPALADKS